MTHLIMVRHGETEANVKQVWQGALDAPLTARGQEQVLATARYMAELGKRYPVDAFYVSPLPRAQSTATAIARAIAMQPIIDDQLREFDLGDWEGRTFQDLKESEDLWGKWRVDPDFAPPNGESPRSFARRAVRALSALVEKHAGQTVLAVTHGGLICNALATWLGAGPDDWRRWEPHNCAVSILAHSASGWQGLAVNSVAHLPATAIVDADDVPVYADPS